MIEREEKIQQRRRQQPLVELKRKREKAARRGFWTAEDIDYSEVAGAALAAKIRVLDTVPE